MFFVAVTRGKSRVALHERENHSGPQLVRGAEGASTSYEHDEKSEVRSQKYENAFQTSDVKLSRAKGTQPEGIPAPRNAFPGPGEAAALRSLSRWIFRQPRRPGTIGPLQQRPKLADLLDALQIQ